MDPAGIGQFAGPVGDAERPRGRIAARRRVKAISEGIRLRVVGRRSDRGPDHPRRDVAELDDLVAPERARVRPSGAKGEATNEPGVPASEGADQVATTRPEGISWSVIVGGLELGDGQELAPGANAVSLLPRWASGTVPVGFPVATSQDWTSSVTLSLKTLARTVRPSGVKAKVRPRPSRGAV